MMTEEKNYEYKVSAASRVNIIGEHIDYCGGKVFPAALSLKNTVYIRKNGTNKINISWTTLPDTVTLDIDKLDSYKSLKYGNYQAGSAYVWKNAGHKLIGCDMLQVCEIPFGSGLSSSAAIETSTIAALAAIAGENVLPTEIAALAHKAEKDYVGVNCGIMDQYASACGKKNHAMLLDCKTLHCEYIPLNLKGYKFVIANSNKPHNLIESKYNERRAETETALNILKEKMNIVCLAEVSESDLEKYRELLPKKIYNRARHVIEECARVDQAVKALKEGNIADLGRVLNASHESLKNLYEVTGAELDCLAENAQKHAACVGSRMTGAGFGGCTISIVESSAVEDFKKTVGELYKKSIGYDASFYDVSIEDGLSKVKI